MSKLHVILGIVILSILPGAEGVFGRQRHPVRHSGGHLRKRRHKRKPVMKNAPAGITTTSGLTIVVTKHGTGVLAKAGDTVSVHYTGTLTNGVKFDSSRDRGEPISFKLGTGNVIKGWDEGIALMHVGDQAVLIIPPAIAYGPKGAGGGVIPPDATLIFIVELVDAKP